MVRYLISKILYFLHFVVIIANPIFLFIPSSFWPSRIWFHFWYNIVIFVTFYLWGLIWTLKHRDKVYDVCWLTSLMQLARGYSLFDERNYKHSFIREAFHDLRIRVSLKFVNILSYIFFGISVVFYILMKFGIILY